MVSSPSNSNDSVLPARRRHSKYYLQHGTDIFLVSFHPSKYNCPINSQNLVEQIENTLYKISRDVLCSDSQVFRDTFALGVPGETGNTQMDGSFDQNPIILQQQCTKDEFDYLLSWLYPGLYEATYFKCGI